MVDNKKKLPKVFNYFQDEDQFAGGVAFCAGCTLELNARFVSRVMGKNTVLVGTPSCSAPVLNGQNTAAWHKLGHYACTMTGVASSATGLTRYYQRAGIEANVVCFTGDGCAQDIGFQTMSGAAERNEKMIYICYDNEGYMNTGIQRSSATPYGASTSTTPTGTVSIGKPTAKKDLPMLMSMHDIPYVATATLSHLEDYAKKLTKAMEKAKEGFVYLHVFCPCLVGWKIPMDSSIQVCRAAVRSNYFPLWEAEDGRYQITQKVAKPKPIDTLTKLMGKFKHLKEEDLAILQGMVDKRFNILQALCAGAPKAA
ncbi:MAG: thiamine pyrophosphate-dependent enzyme [Desulfobacteraceae bacterium]|jgi:pyruvate/2-oxoacid:ferredoxin oxidoreductase beta subunit